MSHTMKLWERIIEARIRKEVTIAEQQFGFMPGRSTTDAIFCLRMLLEKWTEGQKAVHCAFIDLEKAYDRVPREELWECLRLAETSECYIRIIQDMYDGATTTVRSAAGLTEEFKVGVGLHQGSALSPFLFVVIMDRLTENIRKDAPWDMLFADDIVLCRQNHRELEEDLEIWRNALERRALKVSRSKTEYMRVGGVDDGEELKLQEEKVKKAKNFKYLGSTVSNDGRCEEEVRRRIQAGWLSWRKVSGVLCDRKLSAKVKGKIYKSVVRPAMLYGMETVAVTERQMGKMEVAELKMVRWALGVTRKDKIRNEYVRGTAKIAKLGEKLRNVRLRWYGHVKRREEDYDFQINNLNKQAKIIATKLNFDKRIETFPNRGLLVTLKDYKSNFNDNPKCRLINPAESAVEKISKFYRDKINQSIDANLNSTNGDQQTQLYCGLKIYRKKPIADF